MMKLGTSARKLQFFTGFMSLGIALTDSLLMKDLFYRSFSVVWFFVGIVTIFMACRSKPSE
jgi:hypothetical protein